MFPMRHVFPWNRYSLPWGLPTPLTQLSRTTARDRLARIWFLMSVLDCSIVVSVMLGTTFWSFLSCMVFFISSVMHLNFISSVMYLFVPIYWEASNTPNASYFLLNSSYMSTEKDKQVSKFSVLWVNSCPNLHRTSLTVFSWEATGHPQK